MKIKITKTGNSPKTTAFSTVSLFIQIVYLITFLYTFYKLATPLKNFSDASFLEALPFLVIFVCLLLTILN